MSSLILDNAVKYLFVPTERWKEDNPSILTVARRHSDGESMRHVVVGCGDWQRDINNVNGTDMTSHIRQFQIPLQARQGPCPVVTCFIYEQKNASKPHTTFQNI